MDPPLPMAGLLALTVGVVLGTHSFWGCTGSQMHSAKLNHRSSSGVSEGSGVQARMDLLGTLASHINILSGNIVTKGSFNFLTGSYSHCIVQCFMAVIMTSWKVMFSPNDGTRLREMVLL